MDPLTFAIGVTTAAVVIEVAGVLVVCIPDLRARRSATTQPEKHP